jgi:hypothetical protein
MISDIRHDPLAELSAQGVAVWLDDLSRELLASGELQSLITGRHVVGVTINPTIFASALGIGRLLAHYAGGAVGVIYKTDSVCPVRVETPPGCCAGG